MGHLLTVLMVLLWSRITLFCWTKSKWSAICNLSRRVGSGIRVWRWHAVRWIEVRLWHVRWKSAICNCTWDYICCATKHSIIMITKKLSSRYFQAVIHLWLPWAISSLLVPLYVSNQELPRHGQDIIRIEKWEILRVLQKPGKALPTSHPLFRNPANPAAERFFIALFSITFPLYSTFYYITQIPSSEPPRTHSQCPGQCVRVCQVARRIIAHRTHVSDI